MRSGRSILSLGLALLLGTTMAMGGVSVLAQDGTPVTDEGTGRPAHIHVGSCPEVGDVVAPLNHLTSPGGGASDTGRGIPAQYSWTNVPMSLDDILAGEHAINVHESDENIGTYIACGDLGGTVDENGSLVVGLAEVEGSGYSGIAVLTPNPNDGATTDVSVFVAEGLSGASPEAAEEGAAEEEAAAPAEAAVTIQDFAFGPQTLEIAAGTTVTFTNNDSAPHTATADDGSFDTGQLDQGASASVTFDTPGTYTYVCAFHPNMTGTIVVS